MQVDRDLVVRWQAVVDLVSRIINVPAALIMRVDGPDIGVFVSSRGGTNPYRVGEKEVLAGSGLYCETVVNTRDRLLVPNALKEPRWCKSPDVPRGMISYLGLPIALPDGEVFGTLCVLDSKENAYSQDHLLLMEYMKSILEAELALVHANMLLGSKKESLYGYVADVQALRTLLPICMHCKKIRNDEGAWETVESFIERHTPTAFTHSLCQACLETHYPGMVTREESGA